MTSPSRNGLPFALPFFAFCPPDGPSSTKNGTTLLGCEICRLKFTACHVRLRTSSQLDGWASSFSLCGSPFSSAALRPAFPPALDNFIIFSRFFFVATYKIATGHTKSNQSTHMAPVTKTTVNRLLAAYPFPRGFGFALPLSSGGGFPIPTNQHVNLLHTFPFNSNQITGTSHLNF